MRVVLAGATGAIGRPLIRHLKDAGHAVFGLARSPESARALTEAGAEAVTADALDAAAVQAAIARVRPRRRHQRVDRRCPALHRSGNGSWRRSVTTKFELRGTSNLLAAMREAGVRRYILQSSGFWYAPGAGLADESEPFALTRRRGYRRVLARMLNWNRRRRKLQG